ncbi:hypothetical protein [Glycomyces terrestris]|uniref:DUF4190 domain-containing protein n=1 Tax=Glycomyces terrestris TaxID=2493553 RepID=A0A426UV12_9ACTN|nr:hypothetical protein [Glycomyces terrestris]RRR98175.1 hypothetical protein EIW28_14755 [Glycomyces terrestris]
MLDPFTDAPVAPQGDRPPQNGLGTASLAIGMCSFALLWLPFGLNVAWIGAAVAVVFGAIGLAWACTGLATNRSTAAGGFFSGLGTIAATVAIVWIATDERPYTTYGQDVETPSPSVSESPVDPSGFEAGVWQVGADIAPGTYATQGGDTDAYCTAERRSGEEVLGELTVVGLSPGRITVLDTDAEIEFAGSCSWRPAGPDNLADADGEYGDGVWEAGTEIPPSAYATDASDLDGCYAFRLSGFTMALGDDIGYEYVPGGEQGSITVEEGDAGVHFIGGCVWTAD